MKRGKGKMKTMKKITIMMFVVVLALSLAACGSTQVSKDNAEQASDKVYKVGIDLKYPPFEYEENGEYQGIDVDLIKAIAAEEGFNIDITAMDFGGIIPAMQANQLDIAIAGMSITDERKKVIEFSEPYYESGLVLVVNKDNSDINSPEDLKGKRIAIKQGTTGALKAEELAKEFGAEVRYFNDSPSMFQEVVNGGSDVTIEDYPVVAYKIAKDPNSGLKITGEKLTGANFGIGVQKGNTELANKINDGLKKLKENGKYDEIVNQYLK